MLHREQLQTTKRDDMIDITRQVAAAVARSGMEEGIAIVYCPHTTAGIAINENADPDVKRDVLAVDGALLAARGPVDAEVARQLAAGVRRLLGADWGLATTGVAGPGPQDGHSAGTVHVAVSGPGCGGAVSQRLRLRGDRTAVRTGSVEAVLGLLRGRLIHSD